MPRRLFDADVSSVAISRDGRHTAAAAGASVRVWETQTGRVVSEKRYSLRVLSVSFSPTGSLLAAGTIDGRIEILSVPDLTLVKELSLSTRLVTLSFSPDGAYLGAAGTDRFAIWEGKIFKNVVSEEWFNIRGATFSPAGHAYAVYSIREAKVWTGQGTSLLAPSNVYTLHELAISPDGEYLLGASETGVHIWSLRDKTARFLSRGEVPMNMGIISEPTDVTGLALSPDGAKVAILYADGRGVVTPWRPKDLIAETCRRLGERASGYFYEIQSVFPSPYHDYCRNPL